MHLNGHTGYSVKGAKHLAVLVLFFIPKIKAEARLFYTVMLIWTILLAPILVKGPVEERLLHKGTVLEVMEEVFKTKGPCLMFILRVYRVLVFEESHVAHIVIQPPRLLVGEHPVG